MIKNLREEEKIHHLVQLITFYDKLAEKHLWKFDFLQIFQRLKEVIESNFLTVESFFSNRKFSRLCVYRRFEFPATLPVLQIHLKCFIFTNLIQESIKFPEKVGNSNPLCKVSKIFVSEKTWTVSGPECALLPPPPPPRRKPLKAFFSSSCSVLA